MNVISEPGEPQVITTSEWIKGLLAVLVVVGIVIVLPLVLLLTSAMCGCETRPA